MIKTQSQNNEIRQFKNKVWNKVEDKVGYEVSYKVRWKVGYEVSHKVRWKVHYQVGIKLCK